MPLKNHQNRQTNCKTWAWAVQRLQTCKREHTIQILKTLQNECLHIFSSYLLPHIGFDTAKNEPCINLQTSSKIWQIGQNLFLRASWQSLRLSAAPWRLIFLMRTGSSRSTATASSSFRICALVRWSMAPLRGCSYPQRCAAVSSDKAYSELVLVIYFCVWLFSESSTSLR